MKESNCLLWFFCNLCCICKTEAAIKLSLLVIFVNNLHGMHFFNLIYHNTSAGLLMSVVVMTFCWHVG